MLEEAAKPSLFSRLIRYGNRVKVNTCVDNVCDLVVRGVVEEASGYGRVCRELVLALDGLGVKVGLISHSTGFPSVLSEEQKEVIIRAKERRILDGTPRIFILSPPYAGMRYVPGGGWVLDIRPRDVIFTMFEANSVPNGWAEHINLFSKCLVPSTFCYNVFRSSGVEVPLFVVPLGVGEYYQRNFKKKREGDWVIATNDWQPRKNWKNLIISFIRAFRRTHINLLVRAFVKQDSKQMEVVLGDIKRWSEESGIPPREWPKIEVLPVKHLSDEQMPGMYYDCKWYVSATLGEGFGLGAAEAGACGLGVCAPKYGGLLDFLKEENSWLVRVKEEVSEELGRNHYLYKDLVVGVPDNADLIEKMRSMVFGEYKSRSEKLKNLIRTEFTWKKSATKLLEVVF